MKTNQDDDRLNNVNRIYDVLAADAKQARQCMSMNLNDAGWLVYDIALCLEIMQSISFPVLMDKNGRLPEVKKPKEDSK